MFFVVRTFLGRPSYCLDWEPRKDTAADVAKGRARRIPVSTRVLANVGFDGVIKLYEDGHLK